MADRTIATVECAVNEAKVIQTALAAGKLRLFDDTLSVDVNTTRADMIAAETTLTGYPAGGYDLDAWLGPNGAAGGGVALVSPATEVAYASGDAVTLGGWWVETGDPADKPLRVGVFDPPITLAAIPDGFTWIRSLVYGRNA